MRKVLVELHLDWVRPEVVCGAVGEVTVKLGPNLGYEAIREALSDELSEDEWLEFQAIWSSDGAGDRVFRRLDSGALLMHR